VRYIRATLRDFVLAFVRRPQEGLSRHLICSQSYDDHVLGFWRILCCTTIWDMANDYHRS